MCFRVQDLCVVFKSVSVCAAFLHWLSYGGWLCQQTVWNMDLKGTKLILRATGRAVDKSDLNKLFGDCSPESLLVWPHWCTH